MVTQIAVGSCFAPWGIPNAPLVTCNESKSIISHGDTCEPLCNDGYTPSAELLYCSNSALDPQTFICMPNNCTAPDAISYALPTTCQEGTIIPHGTMCTPNCYPLFCCSGWCDLICNKGEFEPRQSYDCVWCYLTTTTSTTTTSGIPCNVTNLSNTVPLAHPTTPCRNAYPTVEWQGNCTPRCTVGYMPDIEAIWCIGSEGKFTPDTWDCVRAPKCRAPDGMENGQYLRSRRCMEGGLIESQAECTTHCAVNYRGVPEKLYCEEGVFTPTTFVCEQVVYVPPDAVHTSEQEPDAALSAIVGMGLGAIIGALSALGAVVLVIHACTKRRAKGNKKPKAAPRKQKLKTSKHQYSSFTGGGRRRGRGRV